MMMTIARPFGWTCNLFSVSNLIKYDKAVMAYEIMNNLCPNSLQGKFTMRFQISAYATRLHYISPSNLRLLLLLLLSEETNCEISNFMDVYVLRNLIKIPTCYKSADNTSAIDMFLTNKTSGFQNTTTIEVGLSDFHLMILTVLKSGFVKKGPRIVTYRDYSKFDPIKFRNDLKRNLAKSNAECSVFENFNSVAEAVLNNHVPLKQKYLRANDAPFMTKTLRKAIMLRTQLRNRLNRYNTSENWTAFKKQRNKCVKILRQAKHLIMETFI